MHLCDGPPPGISLRWLRGRDARPGTGVRARRFVDGPARALSPCGGGAAGSGPGGPAGRAGRGRCRRRSPRRCR
ncbi:hypothetical protein F9278_29015 [Streptomyces phaeolivaceus]|uniref:Uncharacterized protein n=1 Tax=Streptomyces phaeolivaceus TaxID=2653200 RepID=A0A5P8K947_9ACTN|nr:hypothetical protein F9278_29015 [Streptomyces phaeolivaceus]